MKILVCVSSVPDTIAKINFTEDGKLFDKTGVQFVINPNDEVSLNKAIDLQEENTDITITILTVGDASAEPVIRKSLAIGANEGIRIDSEPKDSFFVASQIAKVVKEEAFDLILMGKESIDYNGGVVPGFVAAMLDYPFVNGVIGLDIEGNIARVVREIEGGKETVEVTLPAVIAAQRGLVEEASIRIANMRGIMQARTKKIKIIDPEIIDPKLEVIGYEKPKKRGEVIFIDKDNVAELVRIMREEIKVI